MGSQTTVSYSYGSSRSSSICYIPNTEPLSLQTSDPYPIEIPALRRPFESYRSILESPDFIFRSDAKIVIADDREIPVHRRILSERNPFFKNLFYGGVNGKERSGKFEMKELGKDFDVGFDALVAVLDYLYTWKTSLFPEGVCVCVCVDDECLHVGCRPAVDFMLEVLYASFTFEIPELVSLYQRHLVDMLDKVVVDDILVILSVVNMCDNACDKVLTKCIEIVVKSNIDVVTLEKALPYDTVKQIMDSRLELGLGEPGINSFPDKHVKRIHRALDSDDFELVKMLLREGHTNLDDANALHYAVAYCDAKITTELLDLSLADVNHRNPRGYTVLHVSAMRKEPKIMVSLLTKGARPFDLTSDGRKALQISKRLTKFVDYNRYTEKGKFSPKDRLCIEILEEAERRNPLFGEASFSLAMACDDLRIKLLYLENRVGLAKLIFPMEAKILMDIAQVDGTLEFPLSVNTQNPSVALRTGMDLNKAPFRIEEEHLNRMRALSKAVELGRSFFPRCSEVLNKIMDADDDELTELAFLGNDAADERPLKKRRYMELQEILCKAFIEDKEEFDRPLILSSPSTPKGALKNNSKLTLKK